MAVVENGQNDKNWKYIHLMPSEVVKVANDLRARRVLPVHSSKFALANHAWDQPLEDVARLSKAANVLLVTPLIGEQVNLNDSLQTFSPWWRTVK